jgi:hypothetical protein
MIAFVNRLPAMTTPGIAASRTVLIRFVAFTGIASSSIDSPSPVSLHSQGRSQRGARRDYAAAGDTSTEIFSPRSRSASASS